jgi:hypothetical protein
MGNLGQHLMNKYSVYEVQERFEDTKGIESLFKEIVNLPKPKKCKYLIMGKSKVTILIKFYQI